MAPSTVTSFVLTGGIGAGKSSVLKRFLDRGATVVDADVIVARLQKPGQPVLERIVARFGPTILAEDSTLDRIALASVVFADPDALSDLEQIVHPAVRDEIQRQLEAFRQGVSPREGHDGDQRCIVVDIPLVEDRENPHGVDGFIVVDCPPEVVKRRLQETRSMSLDEAERRIGAQISRRDRLALADFVIDNSGSVGDLDAEVARCWSWMATFGQ